MTVTSPLLQHDTNAAITPLLPMVHPIKDVTPFIFLVGYILPLFYHDTIISRYKAGIILQRGNDLTPLFKMIPLLPSLIYS